MPRCILTHARAGLDSEMAKDDAWDYVSVRASVLPEDMQDVFMMVAHAANEGWPCPGDAAIARAYGWHALPRARGEAGAGLTGSVIVGRCEKRTRA